jgi:Ca-activated chloride channel family protein
MLMRFFTTPVLLAALAALPALGLLALLARRGRRRLLARLGLPGAVGAHVDRPRGRWRAGVGWALGLAALAVGAAGPRWGSGPPPPTAPGRDIAVVLDLSRSMLARDALPSRLGRAKEALRQFADAVQARGGHRLALVVFAARASVACPLTHDYNHFRAKLADMEADPPPAAVRPGATGSVSGTRIGSGLRKAVEAHDPRAKGAQDILLVSDGDDPAGDDEWRDGLSVARAAGIPVSVVGVGDPQRDSPIPAGEGRLQYQGAEVHTRLHEDPLRTIAARTGGAYIAARTAPPDLGAFFREQIAPKPTREAVAGTLPQPVGRQEWCLAAALALIAGAVFRPPTLWQAVRWLFAKTRSWVKLSVRRAALMMVALLLVSAAPTPDDWLRRGNDALTRRQFDAALASYDRAAERTTDPGQVAFNQGVALFQLGRFREAELHFRRSLSDATGERRTRGLYNLGCSLLQESQGRRAAPLRLAVGCFERALDAAAADDPLADDLRTNLELAKRLLAQVRATSPHAEDEPPDSPYDRPPSPPPGGVDDRDPASQGRQATAAQASPDGQPRPVGQADGKNRPQQTDQRPPGKGNLPPLPDEDALTPLTPEDARAHLESAAERIAQERRTRLLSTAPAPSTKFPEW